MGNDENEIRQQIEKLLDNANSIIGKHEEFHRKTGSLFNVFEILNIKRYEVACHEAFIYDLINPAGSHGQGDRYLKLFLEKVLSWDLYDFGEKNIKVFKEFPISDNKRLDLRIESSKSLVIIEMKIDQEDSEGQLDAYFKELENSPKNKSNKALLYLTLMGTKPVCCEDFKKEYCISDCKSFKKEILDWIEACIKESIFLSGIREVLQQYANIVRELTNQVEGDLAMELITLLQEKNNLKIAQDIVDVVHKMHEQEKEFWNNVALELNKLAIMTKKFDFFIEDQKPYTKKVRDDISEYVGLEYKFDKQNGKNKITLGIYSSLDSCVFLGFSDSDNNEYNQILLEAGYVSSDIEGCKVKNISKNMLKYVIFDHSAPVTIANEIFAETEKIYNALKKA